MRKILLALIVALLFGMTAHAQQTGVVAITVTNSSANITVGATCSLIQGRTIVVSENSATPSALYSITPRGSSTAIHFAAGAYFEFDASINAPFVSGQGLGTIVATTSGPFTFVAVEMPVRSAPSTISIGGGGGGPPSGAAGGDLGGSYPNPNVANLSHVTNSSLPNTGLANPSVTIAGHSVALGATQAIACGDLSNAASGCSTAANTFNPVSPGTLGSTTPGTYIGGLTGNASGTAGSVVAGGAKWKGCGSRGLGDGLNAITAGTYLQ